MLMATKSIRQIAEELGVSKTAVRKQIANLGLQSDLRKNGNQFAIDEEQEAQIIRAFGGKSQTENGNQFANQTEIGSRTANHEVSDLVSVLQSTVTVLQEQLQVKDQQIAQQAQTIDRLSDALAAAQQTAAAAQALHAGTIQHQLSEDAEQDRPAEAEPEQPHKRGWFSRFFDR